MADKEGQNTESQKYVNDPRIACKYGTKCYQKNAIHLQKYKHPPATKKINNDDEPPKKKIKLDLCRPDEPEEKPRSQDSNPEEKIKSDENSEQKNDTISSESQSQKINTEEESSQEENMEMLCLGRTPKNFDPKDFIKEKFLVRMPEDFYNFWDFCKGLNGKCPQEALKAVGLTLVGPYDVLAGKFYDVPDQPNENYLIHWRYFYDPPEFQTVLKGEDKTGFHIGYFRDSPKEMPVYLASNFAKTDGIFKCMGDNIFAAVYLYLEELKKTGDPFKKMHIGRIQSAVKKKAEELDLSLSEKTQKIIDRDRKIVTRSFSKMGIVVPFNRHTRRGYRDLAITNKELVKLLNNIKNASPQQRHSYLSDLQDVLTNVSIATDECDFGTGIELGLNILAHGVDSLNQTVSTYLATSYRLIEREEFAKIAKAHMKNRRNSVNLSII